MITTTQRPTRSTELRTRWETAAAFVRMGSPRLLIFATLFTLVARLLVAQWGWIDLLLVAITVTLTGFVEWAIHLYLLHCPVDSFRFTKIGTGVSHRQHHIDPPDLNHLVLYAKDAALFLVILTAGTAAWSVPLTALAGQKLLPHFLTALLAGYAGLLHYEWVHLVSHTKYRPTNRLHARLARNHRLHHYRNERQWLGVTSNLGDRVLGTLPRSKSDVPLSDTARNLDG